MAGGDFQTSREIFDNPIWKNIVEFRLFFLIYGNAIYKKEGYKVSNDLILERGQWLRSTRKLQEDLSYIENRQVKTYSTSVINRCIKKLEREQRICTKTHELGTVFTVINYDMYQGFARPPKENLEQNLEQCWNSVGTVEEQSGNNKNKEKKENKDNKEKDPRQKRVYDDQSIPYRSANYLYTSILKHKPDLKKPNLQAWADDMRKLIEIDGRDPHQIANVINWVITEPFWHSQILSASKLREKWDTLTSKMSSPRVVPINGYKSKSEKDAEQISALKQRIINYGGGTVEEPNTGRGRFDITPDQNGVPQLQFE